MCASHNCSRSPNNFKNPCSGLVLYFIVDKILRPIVKLVQFKFPILLYAPYSLLLRIISGLSADCSHLAASDGSERSASLTSASSEASRHLTCSSSEAAQPPPRGYASVGLCEPPKQEIVGQFVGELDSKLEQTADSLKIIKYLLIVQLIMIIISH